MSSLHHGAFVREMENERGGNGFANLAVAWTTVVKGYGFDPEQCASRHDLIIGDRHASRR